VDEAVRAYADSVVRVSREVLGEHLTAAWIAGSLASGDFDLRRSDIDLLMTCAASFDRALKRQLGERLSHRCFPCPAHGLDLIIYSADEVAELTRSPRYEFSISSGPDWEDEVDFGGPYPGGLIDLAMVRERGIALYGPPPDEAVGPCPREWLLQELANAVRWHETRVHDSFHDPTGSNAVLNACRALHFFSTGVFVSKTAGAQWVLGRAAIPVVGDALVSREAGGTSRRLDRAQVLGFLEMVLSELPIL
jgi:hypothetical protein